MILPLEATLVLYNDSGPSQLLQQCVKKILLLFQQSIVQPLMEIYKTLKGLNFKYPNLLPEYKTHHREVLKPVEFWMLTTLTELEEEDG